VTTSHGYSFNLAGIGFVGHNYDTNLIACWDVRGESVWFHIIVVVGLNGRRGFLRGIRLIASALLSLLQPTSTGFDSWELISKI
jgi:hypothetical protein